MTSKDGSGRPSGKGPSAVIAVTSAALCASALSAAVSAFTVAITLLVTAVVGFGAWLAVWSGRLRSTRGADRKTMRQDNEIAWPRWVPLLVEGYGIFLVVVLGLTFLLIVAYVISRLT